MFGKRKITGAIQHRNHFGEIIVLRSQLGSPQAQCGRLRSVMSFAGKLTVLGQCQYPNRFVDNIQHYTTVPLKAAAPT